MTADVGHDLDGEGEGDEASRSVPFAVFVLFEAGLAPLALVLGYALGQHPLADFVWDVDAALWGVVAALPMIGFLTAVVRWPVGPLGRIKAFFDRELAPVLEGCEWPDLALISVAAGVGEELLFRGVIQGSLARAIGPGAGLAVTAALFGLLHPVSTAYVLIAGLLGGYLGLVWMLSGNLLTAVVAHALYDFVALVVLLNDRRAGSDDDGS